MPGALTSFPPAALPGQSTQRALLHQTESLGVGIFRFEVFSNGFSFAVRVEGNGHGRGRFHFLFDPTASWFDNEPGADPDPYDQPDQQFRLGLEFSDGSRWQNYTDSGSQGLDAFVIGASGHSTGCTTLFWVPALPTAGSFHIHGLWPSVGMDECTATFDADEIRALAGSGLPLLA